MRAKPCVLGLLLIVGLLSSIGSSFAQTPAATQIKNEIARLRGTLKAQPITDANLAPMVEDALKGASAALDAGELYVGLERLGQAEDLLQGARKMANAGKAENSFPAFQSQWKEVSLRLTALDKEAHARDWKAAPLVVRALAEAAQGRAIPLLEGGLGFATANGPKDGLFYVGQAEGEADFSRFCASLKWPTKPAKFRARSLLPELHSLQQKTDAEFQPPKSIDLHPRFIALNSSIKLAQELDATRFYAGALLSYLEGVRHYGMLGAPVLDAAAQAKLKQDLAAERNKLSGSQSDESIAQYFLERAESYVTHADGSVPSADEWRGARVILDEVLPAYDAAQKPAAPLQRASGKTVDITLVRWPYT
jgi:hypothetical protein